MKKVLILMLLITAIIGTSCKKKTDDTTTPTPSGLAVVGTNWTSGNGGLTISQVSGGDVVVTCSYPGQSPIAVSGNMTTDGFSDYFYSSGDKSKPFTLVNFNDPVGTQYKFNLGSVQVTRTVLSKSTTDDFYVGALGMYIKTMQVREDVPAGLTVNGKLTKTKTITWVLNHKFGIVYAQVILTDNSIVEFPLTSTNAGH